MSGIVSGMPLHADELILSFNGKLEPTNPSLMMFKKHAVGRHFVVVDELNLDEKQFDEINNWIETTDCKKKIYTRPSVCSLDTYCSYCDSQGDCCNCQSCRSCQRND